MKSNRLVIVGLGTIGREFLSRISREYEITCVTDKPEAEELLAELKREDVQLIAGDATSRLVLERARVDEADAVIITTTDENINNEVAAILKDHFDPRRVISVAFSRRQEESLASYGVEVLDVNASSALGIRNMIEQKAKVAHAIGIGKEEILEVEVHPNSRLANKRLDFINPIKWRIGIIYRDGNIVMPRPDVILKPKDKVVILGEPWTLKTVSEILTFDFQKFPQQYGSVLIACLCGDEGEEICREINYLFSTFSFEKALIVHGKELSEDNRARLLDGIDVKKVEMKKTSLPPRGAVEDAISESAGRQGLVVLPPSFVGSAGWFMLDSGKKRFIEGLLNGAECPVLIARGTFPYAKMAVPCVEGFDIEHSFETAVEISASLGNEISALLVKPSTYLEGEEEMKAYEEEKKAISSISMSYKMKVESRELQGNPINEVLKELPAYNLLLAGTGHGLSFVKKETLLSLFMKPDVAWAIVKRSPVSALLLPPEEETL
jgi:hypothetical protein